VGGTYLLHGGVCVYHLCAKKRNSSIGTMFPTPRAYISIPYCTLYHLKKGIGTSVSLPSVRASADL
jgi:hypothetical protein